MLSMEKEELVKRIKELEEAIDILGAALKAEALKGENPVSPKCELILKEPPTKDECFDFRAIRARAMCKAWEIMEKERVPFRESITRAWREIKDACAKVTAYI